MKKTRILAVVVCVMAAGSVARADTIRGIDMDFVTIGNAGNGTDPVTGNLYGAVSYSYRIGKYEVTAAQWSTFTSVAGIPVGNPASAYDQSPNLGSQQPISYVSWYEAAQFCNYLTSGDKSKGAYRFSGNNSNPGNFQSIDRVSSISTYGTTYVIPTENEWYKAAYFKPNASGYSLYANGTSTTPIAGVNSNYGQTFPPSGPWDIGSGTTEQNGTFDMMGNLLEWNETLIGSFDSGSGIRGGAYKSDDVSLASSGRGIRYSYYESHDTGFRVVSIPEPCSLVLLGLGGLALRYRKR